MATFDNTKHDVQLNGINYRVATYQKRDQDPFLARFGGSEPSETDLDLFKGQSIKGFENGMLQRFWGHDDDEFSAFSIEGLYPRYGDGVLYKMSDWAEVDNSDKALYIYVPTKDYVFRFKLTYNSPANSLLRIDKDGNTQVITVPASWSGNTNKITGWTVNTNTLYWGDGTTGKLWKLDMSTTSAAEHTTSFGANKLVTYNRKIFSTGTGTSKGILYTISGTTRTEIGKVGNSSTTISDMRVFNHRILMAKPDGLYGYDNVAINAIVDASDGIDDRNFNFPGVVLGQYLFWMPDGFYSFNGASIEKLYDAKDVGFPVDSCVGKDRYWVLHVNDGDDPNRFDEAVGYTPETDEYTARLACYNGQGMYTYSRLDTIVKEDPLDFTGQGQPLYADFFDEAVYISTNYQHFGLNYKVDTTDDGTSDQLAHIITGITDNKLPTVDKFIESVELTFDGTLPAAASSIEFTVEYRISGFDGSGAWTSFGTVYAGDLHRAILWPSNSNITYRRIQFRVKPAENMPLTLGIAKFTMRFATMPDYKNEWVITLNCHGSITTDPLVLKDGSEDTQTVQALRGNIYNARASDSPVTFLDVDYTTLATSIHASNQITEVVLADASLFKSSGLVQIDNEIFIYYSKSGNTLSLKPTSNITPADVRGRLGSTIAAHSSGAKVFPVYRVYVSSIDNEVVQVSDQQDIVYPSDIQLTLKEA